MPKANKKERRKLASKKKAKAARVKLELEQKKPALFSFSEEQKQIIDLILDEAGAPK